jgi:DNA-binding NarL/FixJ family response regulator
LSNPTPDTASVLCVDDNKDVAEAVRKILTKTRGFAWLGTLPDATKLVEFVAGHSVSLVLLDIDMPGRNSFEVLSDLRAFPESRVVMFSGHASRDLIDRALDYGAWGYAVKSDGNEALIECLRKVHRGEIALTPGAERLQES